MSQEVIPTCYLMVQMASGHWPRERRGPLSSLELFQFRDIFSVLFLIFSSLHMDRIIRVLYVAVWSCLAFHSEVSFVMLLVRLHRLLLSTDVHVLRDWFYTSYWLEVCRLWLYYWRLDPIHHQYALPGPCAWEPHECYPEWPFILQLHSVVI